MPEKNKPKIGGISKFANFGGGSKTSEGDSVRTSGLEEIKTQEIQDSQTSNSDGRKDTKTYEHFNGDEPWSADVETRKQQDTYMSVRADAKVVEGVDAMDF